MWSEIAKLATEYGPYGTAICAIAAAIKLYTDARAIDKARIEELRTVISDYHEDAKDSVNAWQNIAKLLSDLRYELERRRRGQ